MNSGSLPEAQAAEKTYPELRSWSLTLAGISILDMLLLVVLVTEHGAQPALVPVADLAPFVYVLTGASVLATSLGVLWVFLRYPKQRKVILVLLAITLGLMVAHLYTINDPATPSCYGSNGVQGCVMDEIYYVPAAQALLSGEKCGPYLDNCNLEHPFLGKGFIAAGIALFGNNDFGWRFFEGLLGTLCIPIVFYICLKFTKDTTLSLYAAFLLAFETFFFVQSSIAVIDIQMIFLGLGRFSRLLRGHQVRHTQPLRRLWALAGSVHPRKGNRGLPCRVPDILQLRLRLWDPPASRPDLGRDGRHSSLPLHRRVAALRQPLRHTPGEQLRPGHLVHHQLWHVAEGRRLVRVRQQPAAVHHAAVSGSSTTSRSATTSCG